MLFYTCSTRNREENVLKAKRFLGSPEKNLVICLVITTACHKGYKIACQSPCAVELLENWEMEKIKIKK